MKTIVLNKGLDLPLAGRPQDALRPGNEVRQVALLGDDYIGMKPTMLVKVEDRVVLGQPLFHDKGNPAALFTAPASGTVVAVNRGEKRRFESLVIDVDGDERLEFALAGRAPEDCSPAELRQLLQQSGLWTALRTRPYGRTPTADAEPVALFITAIDSEPLSGRPQTIILPRHEEFHLGLRFLRRLVEAPIHYCTGEERLEDWEIVEGVTPWRFVGPHPAGLPSTHIHFIDPVHENRTVWHIGYQDVIAIGHLMASGTLLAERVVALGGEGVITPALLRTRLGASLPDLCRRELSLEPLRIVSGSLLSGRECREPHVFLGRYHNQVSVVAESAGRSLFNWLMPGRERFSVKPVFASAFLPRRPLPMNTALWGGRRAIYPLGTYEQVMPLDIIATALLKAVVRGDTEQAKALGCLELIEEDLGPLSFVCPGKNEFAPALRQVLSAIEQGN